MKYACLIALLISFDVHSQIVCSGTLGTPIVNVTFGNGTTNPAGTLASVVPGATTTYTYAPVTGNPPALVYDGEYSIVCQVPNNAAWFAGAKDRSGIGYMAFFNAATTAGEFYKQTITGLNPNSVYEFAAWFGNVLKPGIFGSPSYPNITFEIRDAVTNNLLITYNTGNVPMSTIGSLVWKQYGALFATPPGVTSVKLFLINNNIGGTALPGNDFAVDDITFRECICTGVSAFAGADKSICFNDTIQLSASGGTKYRWSPSLGLSNDTIANPKAFPSTTQDYIVTVSNNNCSAKDTIRINVGQCKLCPSGSNGFPELIVNGNFEAGNSGFSSDYTFTNNAANQADYAIGTNASTINSIFSPCRDHSSGTGKFLVCNGASNITKKIWSETVPVKPFTNYLFSFWLNNISNNQTAKLNVIIDGSNKDTFACINTSCLWQQQGLLWSSGNSTNVTISIIDIITANNGNDFGIDDVSFHECNCFSFAPALSNKAICLGDSIQLNVSNASVTKYKWSPSLGISNDTIANPWFKPSITTKYYIQVSNQFCSRFDSVLISVNQKPTINLGNDTFLCDGNNFVLQSPKGIPRIWSTGDTSETITVAIKTDTINYLPQKYWVTVGSGNCITSDTILLFSVNKPKISLLNINNVVCIGEKVTLSVNNISNNLKLKWNTGDTSKQIVVFPISNTKYIVQYSNGECNFSDSVLIQVVSKPIIVASADDTICLGNTITLKVIGANSYLWNTGAIDSNIVVNPSTNTRYWVLGSNGGCVSDTQFINIVVLPTPLSSFDANPKSGSFPLNVNFNNQSKNATTFIWDFGDGDTSTTYSPSHVYNAKGLYQIKLLAFNSIGCSDTSSATVIINPPYKIFIPTVFSPDGDGLNDYFDISMEGIKSYTGYIFDRWGEQIYKWNSTDPKSWDGKYRNLPCPTGAYIYVLDVKDSENYGHHYKGWIYLTR